MIKKSIQKEHTTFDNIYAPNIGGPKYIKPIVRDIKGEFDNNTIIVGDFNTLLTSMDRSSRQKINKETRILSDTLGQLDLIGIYRTFHPKTAEYKFFSETHGMFSRICHMLVCKRSLNKFKTTEITLSIFSDHNSIKLEINSWKKNGKTQTHED